MYQNNEIISASQPVISQHDDRTEEASILLYWDNQKNKYIVDYGTINDGDVVQFDNIEKAIDFFWEIFYEYESDYFDFSLDFDKSEEWINSNKENLYKTGFFERTKLFKEFISY